jgi:Domain of unknown function (DUF4347)
MLQKDDLHRHIVFIDSAVDDYPSLVKGVVSGVEVIVLTPTLNGVTQISEVLADRLDIATVHIVSHGSPGCLYLGNTQLSLDTLKCYVTQLQTWFSGQLPRGNAPSLLLYGCNVAAGDAGEEFVERLQQLTGAHIAASAGRIGNAAKGGNWHLERHPGKVDIDLAFLPELMQVYSGIFATSPLNNWQLNLERLRVEDAQEERFFSNGDEPYFVVIGFRSRFNTPSSTQTFWSGFLDDDWAKGVKDESQRNIPRQMGSVSFPNVQSVTSAELLSGEGLELVGAVAIAFESDATPFSTIRTLVDKLRSTLEGELRRLIEEGQLNPANLGSGISGALNRVKSSIEPSLFEKVKIGLQSFGDPDDLIGIHTFLFAAADPTLANSIPFPSLPNATIGALADRQFRIGNNPIVFSGDGATYEVTTSVSSISVVPPSSPFQVTNTNDSGLGSLRQAIAQANASPGLNTISFVGSVFNDPIPDTVTLTSGQLTISDSLTINGLGADKLTVSGNNNSRVFEVDTSTLVEINGLTITKGKAQDIYL